MIVTRGRKKGYTPPRKTLPRSIGHYKEFIDAAKGGNPASCNFDFGGVLTEVVLLGTIAQRLGKVLDWDAANGRFTNSEAANQLIQPTSRAGWAI